jgi:hypothetical protein
MNNKYSDKKANFRTLYFDFHLRIHLIKMIKPLLAFSFVRFVLLLPQTCHAQRTKGEWGLEAGPSYTRLRAIPSFPEGRAFHLNFIGGLTFL